MLLAEVWPLRSALGSDASCLRLRFGVSVCAGFRCELLLAPLLAVLALSLVTTSSPISFVFCYHQYFLV
jgi:hypothetical protein